MARRSTSFLRPDGVGRPSGVGGYVSEAGGALRVVSRVRAPMRPPGSLPAAGGQADRRRMAEMYGEVTCAAGCGETGPPGETMTEMLGGDYQCAECLGAVISRASMDDDAVLPDGTRAWAVRSSQRAPRRRAG